MLRFSQSGLPANALHRQLQAGQVLLIIVLVLVITSTIGLSVASRSITSLRTSTEELESQKALSAAEAGIERAIQSNIIPTGVAIQGSNSSNNSSYTTKVTQIQSSSFLVNGGSTTFGIGPNPTPTVIPNIIRKDEGADVWFVDHDVNGNPDYSSSISPQFLNIYWGLASETCNTSNPPAAIEVIIVTRNSPTDIKTYRYAYDSCNRGNNFKSSTSGNYNVPGIPGVTFGNKTPDNDLARNINNIVLMRIIPIYKNTIIGIDACNPSGNSNNCALLPSQGYVVDSTGISGSASYRITTFKGYLQTYLPYLSYGLFVAN